MEKGNRQLNGLVINITINRHIFLALSLAVGSAVADGGELLAALPIPQPPRIQRRIHEGKRQEEYSAITIPRLFFCFYETLSKFRNFPPGASSPSVQVIEEEPRRL